MPPLAKSISLRVIILISPVVKAAVVFCGRWCDELVSYPPTCNGPEIIGEQVLKWCRIGEVFGGVRHYLSGSVGILTSDVCVRSPELILMQLRHHL